MIAGLLFCLAVAGPVHAQQSSSRDSRAKELFVTGQSFYQSGRYRDALVAFETAFRLSGRSNILRSIAYCHENLGEIQQALDVLYRYRGLAAEDKMAEIERHIQRLEDRLREETVVVAPVEGRSEDPQRTERRSNDGVSTAPSSSEQTKKPAARPRTIEPQRAWQVGLGPTLAYSVGGVAIATGGVFAIKAQQARVSAASLCSDGAGFCPRSAAPYINDDGTYSMLADTSFAVGGLALVGATVWMVVNNRAAAGVRVLPTGNGLGLVGSF